MKLLQRGTVALFLLVLAAYVGQNFFLSRNLDRTPPVITCDSDVVDVQVGASDSALLRGVTAFDDKDGDLTREVIIQGVSQLITANTAKITYIVFDSSNNMTTASRTVRYTNYEKPRFVLDTPLVFPIGESIRLLGHLSATDVIDGDISDRIRIVSQNVDPSTAGIYSVTAQVTNSLGDAESLPLKISIVPHSSATPTVELSTYIVYLSQGESFHPSQYITAPAEVSAVKIDSSVDTTQPGTYEVTYTHRGDTAHQTVVIR